MELISLQSAVKSYYSNFTSVTNVWSKLFIHRINEFPNILMLSEIVFCISASNSTVEKIFSTLTSLLSDRHPTMKHSTMEDCLVIAGNSSARSEREKDEILYGAVKKYTKKKKSKKSFHHQAAKFLDLFESSEESLSTDSDTEYNSERLTLYLYSSCNLTFSLRNLSSFFKCNIYIYIYIMKLNQSVQYIFFSTH